MLLLLGISFILWIKLFFFHGAFWRKGPILVRLSEKQKIQRKNWPIVHVIIPARNEAETIEPVITSLLRQDYAGYYDITLVDDESTDGTGNIIRRFRENLPQELRQKLKLVSSAPHAEGWSGKLWALSQGINGIIQKENQDNSFFLFTDADISHDSTHLTALVDKALSDDLDQVSEMVQLRCKNFFEKLLIPPFVFFFCMLYPFSKVNKPDSPVAAGAGGTVLIRRKMLQSIGGIAVLKNALIDDVTLARHVKKKGGRIYLGHSSQAMSLRPYDCVQDIWNMVIRSAYVQLHYSIGWLFLTVILMAVVWLLPFLGSFFLTGLGWQLSLIIYVMSFIAFLPTLSRFHLSLLWAFTFPGVVLFYLSATIASAVNYYRGKGMVWKGRAYVDSSTSHADLQQDPVLND